LERRSHKELHLFLGVEAINKLLSIQWKFTIVLGHFYQLFLIFFLLAWVFWLVGARVGARLHDFCLPRELEAHKNNAVTQIKKK
jgi:hypothetical protein